MEACVVELLTLIFKDIIIVGVPFQILFHYISSVVTLIM
jgi:hypothetical protein